jgi:hypothetical protein
MSGFQGWIDKQIQEAQDRGEFDNLPGAGKPIEGLDDPDPDWWAKRLIEREQLTMPLPTSLALRKEREEIRQTVAAERTEGAVRQIIEDFNARVVTARRRAVGGPPLVVHTIDLDTALAEWREDRAAMAERRQRALDEHRRATQVATTGQSPRRRWLRRLRGTRDD